MTITRRDFLKIANRALLTASGLLGFGALLRFLGYQPESSAPTAFDLGLATDYPLGSHTTLPDVPAVLHHSEAGFSAQSLTCTHLGCTIEKANSGYSCPCHGSHFSEKGQVEQGPATQPLAVLNIEMLDNGHLKLSL